jgi:hypothetical protein
MNINEGLYGGRQQEVEKRGVEYDWIILYAYIRS